MPITAPIQAFRIVGYVYAVLNIVVAICEAIRCLASFGSEHENNTVLALKMIFSLFCFAFAIMLVIGIKREKIEYIIVYRIFVIFRSICGFVYMLINSLIIIVDLANTSSTGSAMFAGLLLILAIALFASIITLELWVLEGIKRYVELPTEIVKPTPAVTPV
ncbi:uncharacterized protein LOC129756588 [Uranotaenia lowii]|uniref:uncharacterized protein LOC129756588 n=1 Tax=Uranotaenia lowii TaxID=190385 RepID=UPI00247A1910|nr:uncharacterized protein LOC129756588 [Uranotaenia lowii]